MTKTEYLLTCLAEECCEVGQRCSKAIRFGLNEVQAGQLSNELRLKEELADLVGVLESLSEHLNWPDNESQMYDLIDKKKEKILKYMEYSKSLGTLVE